MFQCTYTAICCYCKIFITSLRFDSGFISWRTTEKLNTSKPLKSPYLWNTKLCWLRREIDRNHAGRILKLILKLCQCGLRKWQSCCHRGGFALREHGKILLSVSCWFIVWPLSRALPIIVEMMWQVSIFYIFSKIIN